jgi:hypothetical protein
MKIQPFLLIYYYPGVRMVYIPFVDDLSGYLVVSLPSGAAAFSHSK